MKNETLRAYRAAVHIDVEACQSTDTLDLIHRILVKEQAATKPQKAAGGGAKSLWSVGVKVAAK